MDAMIPCKHIHFTYLHNQPGKSQPVVCSGGRPVSVDDFNIEAALPIMQRERAMSSDGDEDIRYYKDYELVALIREVLAAALEGK